MSTPGVAKIMLVCWHWRSLFGKVGKGWICTDSALVRMVITLFLVHPYKAIYLSLAATGQMVSNFKAQPYAQDIVLTWTVRFVPTSYSLDVQCEGPCSIRDIMERKGIKIGSLARRYIITNLLPSSHCFILLKALYNPASLDKGIHRIADTHSLGLSKWNRIFSVLQIFIHVYHMCIYTCMELNVYIYIYFLYIYIYSNIEESECCLVNNSCYMKFMNAWQLDGGSVEMHICKMNRFYLIL